jgi:predicted O-methyltransferase YrrM
MDCGEIAHRFTMVVEESAKHLRALADAEQKKRLVELRTPIGVYKSWS